MKHTLLFSLTLILCIVTIPVKPMLRSGAFKRQTHTKIASKRPATRTIKIKIPFGVPERYHTPPGIPMVYSVELDQLLVEALIDKDLVRLKDLMQKNKKRYGTLGGHIYRAIEDHRRFIDEETIVKVLNDEFVIGTFIKEADHRGISAVFLNSYKTNNKKILNDILNNYALYKQLTWDVIRSVFSSAAEKNDWTMVKKIIERDRLLKYLTRYDFEGALVHLKKSLENETVLTEQEKNILLYLKDIFEAVAKGENLVPEDL